MNIPTSDREDSSAVGFAHGVLGKAGVFPLIGFADVLQDQGPVRRNRHPAKGEEPHKGRLKDPLTLGIREFHLILKKLGTKTGGKILLKSLLKKKLEE